jgi:hypothetical protein
MENPDDLLERRGCTPAIPVRPKCYGSTPLYVKRILCESRDFLRNWSVHIAIAPCVLP